MLHATRYQWHNMALCMQPKANFWCQKYQFVKKLHKQIALVGCKLLHKSALTITIAVLRLLPLEQFATTMYYQ